MSSLTWAATSSLITTKLVPPRRSPTDLPREALVNRLVEARRTRCIVLRGGAGCGKTSLLTAWQQSLALLGYEVAWLSLSPDDDEPARFMDYVLASLAQLDASIVREAAMFSGLGVDRDSIERVVIALVKGLAAYGREVVLVIDDLHHIADPLILDGALQFMLEYAPPTFHLAVAARRAVPLALGRLHAQGQLLELDTQDLRFSPDETARFLSNQVGKVQPREAAHLHSMSDGWPAGLALLAVNLRHASPSEPARSPPIHDPGSFASYFEREVLARLAPEEIDGLVRLSACVRFCARLGAVLLAGPGEADDLPAASQLIARLESEHLFIVPVDSTDRERWYRLHPLLREVLLARLRAMLPEDQQVLHARAADWFEAQGLVDEAVRHRLDAGDAQAAAALVERCAENMQLHNDFRGLASILRRLPPALIDQRPELRFLKAQMLMRTRQLDAYERALETLERDTPADDELMRFRLVLSRAGLHVQRDDTAAASQLLPQLRQLPAGADGWTIGAQKNLISLILLHEGDYEGARRVQEEGPPRLVQGEPLYGGSQGMLIGRCFVGLSHELEGNMAHAERHYRDVLRECEQRRERGEPALFATALLGDVLFERGEVAAVIDMLEPQVDVMERSSIPDVVVRTLLVLARAHRLAGRQLESLAYLDRLEDHAAALGLDRLLAAALVEQAVHQLYLLQFAKADALLERLFELEARYSGRQGTLGDIALAVSAARSYRSLANGQLEAAVAQLRTTIELSQQRGNWRRVARLGLLVAVVEAQCNRPDNASNEAMRALNLGHRLGLARSLVGAHPQAPALLTTIRGEASLDPVLAFYIDRLLELQRTPAAEPSTAPAERAPLAEALSQREAELLRMLVLAMPNKKIARALGLSIETVKWHLRNVYRKLDVAGRDEAVTRARDLGLDTD